MFWGDTKGEERSSAAPAKGVPRDRGGGRGGDEGAETAREVKAGKGSAGDEVVSDKGEPRGDEGSGRAPACGVMTFGGFEAETSGGDECGVQGRSLRDAEQEDIAEEDNAVGW